MHGGPEKAVYGYALSSYAVWRRAFPEHGALWVPGGLGENVTIDGIDEEMVHIGDVVRIGAAMLQVTQPRQPCFKFALRLGDKRLPKAMIGNGRSGWYYRVIETGVLAAGDRLDLLERSILRGRWPASTVCCPASPRPRRTWSSSPPAGPRHRLAGDSARRHRPGHPHGLNVLKSGGLIKAPFTSRSCWPDQGRQECFDACPEDPIRDSRPRRDQCPGCYDYRRPIGAIPTNDSGRDMQWRFASKRTDRSGR